uniref:neuropeptide B isoform X2 n=1 Tax=Jaculus jaculus TaxID=51337 RepID=UPI001E1B1029|nr:neuropeptide B isoform X2 [Jaculus jaculus]
MPFHSVLPLALHLETKGPPILCAQPYAQAPLPLCARRPLPTASRYGYKAPGSQASVATLPACFWLPMARCATLVPAALALLLLLTLPGLAWYKPATGPRHYSVGRAAGLLSNFHRSMSTRRSESPVPFVGTVHPRRTSAFSELLPSLRTLPPTAHLGCVRQGHHSEPAEL